MEEQNKWQVLDNRIAMVQQLRNKLLIGKRTKTNPISKVYRHLVDVLVQLTLYSSQLNVDTRPTKLYRVDKLTKNQLNSLAIQITYFQKLAIAFDQAKKMFDQFSVNQCKSLQISLLELSRMTIDENQVRIYDQQVNAVVTQLQILAQLPAEQVQNVYEKDLSALTQTKVIKQFQMLKPIISLLHSLSTTSLQQVMTLGCWENYFKDAQGFKPNIKKDQKKTMKRANYANTTLPRRGVAAQRSQNFKAFRDQASKLVSQKSLGPEWEKATSRKYSCPLAVTALLPKKLRQMNLLRTKIQNTTITTRRQTDLRDTKIMFLVDLTIISFISICNIVRVQLLLWLLSMKRCQKIGHFTVAYQLKLLQISSQIFKLGFQYHYINLNMGFASRLYYRGIASYMIDIDRNKLKFVTQKYTQYLKNFHGKSLKQVGNTLKQQGLKGKNFQKQLAKINQKGFQLKQTLQTFNTQLQKVMQTMPQVKKMEVQEKQRIQIQLKQNIQKVNEKISQIPEKDLQSMIKPDLPIDQSITPQQMGSAILIINQNLSQVVQNQTEYIFQAAKAYQVPVTEIRQEINEGIKAEQKMKERNLEKKQEEQIQIQIQPDLPRDAYSFNATEELKRQMQIHRQNQLRKINQKKKLEILNKANQGTNVLPTYTPNMKKKKKIQTHEVGVQGQRRRNMGIMNQVAMQIQKPPRKPFQHTYTTQYQIQPTRIQRTEIEQRQNVSIQNDLNRPQDIVQQSVNGQGNDDFMMDEQIQQYSNKYQQSAAKQSVKDEQIANGMLAQTFVTSYTNQTVIKANEKMFNVISADEVYNAIRRFEDMQDDIYDVLIQQHMIVSNNFETIKAEMKFLTQSVEALRRQNMKNSEEVIKIMKKMEKKIRKDTLQNKLLMQESIMIFQKNTSSIIQQVSQNGTSVVNQIVQRIEEIAKMQLQNKQMLMQNHQQGEQILKSIQIGFQQGKKLLNQSWGYQHIQITQDLQQFLNILGTNSKNMETTLENILQRYHQAQGPEKQMFKQYLEGFMTQMNALKILIAKAPGFDRLESYIIGINNHVSQTSEQMKAYLQNITLYQKKLQGEIRLSNLRSVQQFQYLANGVRDGIHILSEQINTQFYYNRQIYEKSIIDVGSKFNIIQQNMSLNSAKIDFALEIQRNAQQNLQQKINQIGNAVLQANRATATVNQQMNNLRGSLIAFLCSISTQTMSPTQFSQMSTSELLKKIQQSLKRIKQNQEEMKTFQNQLVNGISDILISKGYGSFRRLSWKRLILSNIANYEQIISKLEEVTRNLTAQNKQLLNNNNSSQYQLKKRLQQLKNENNMMKDSNQNLKNTIQFLKNQNYMRRMQYNQNDVNFQQQSKIIQKLKLQVSKLQQQVESGKISNLDEQQKMIYEQRIQLQIQRKKNIQEKLKYSQNLIKQIQRKYSDLEAKYQKQSQILHLRQKQFDNSQKKSAYYKMKQLGQTAEKKRDQDVRDLRNRLQEKQKQFKEKQKQWKQKEQKNSHYLRSAHGAAQIWTQKARQYSAQLQALKKKMKQNQNAEYDKYIRQLTDKIEQERAKVVGLERALRDKDMIAQTKMSQYRQLLRINDEKARKSQIRAAEIEVNMNQLKKQVQSILENVEIQTKKHQKLIEVNQKMQKQSQTVQEKLQLLQRQQQIVLKQKNEMSEELAKLNKRIQQLNKLQGSWIEQKKKFQQFNSNMQQVIVLLQGAYFKGLKQQEKYRQLIHYWTSTMREGQLKKKMNNIIANNNTQTIVKIQDQKAKIESSISKMEQTQKKIQQYDGIVTTISELRKLSPLADSNQQIGRKGVIQVQRGVIQQLIGQLKYNTSWRKRYDQIAMDYRQALTNSSLSLSLAFQAMQKNKETSMEERLRFSKRVEQYQKDVKLFQQAMKEISSKKKQYQQFSTQYREFVDRITRFDRQWVDKVIEQHKVMNDKKKEIQLKYGEAGASGALTKLFWFAVKTIHRTIKWMLKLLNVITKITAQWKTIQSNNQQFKNFLPLLLKVFDKIQEMIQKFLLSLLNPQQIFQNDDHKEQLDFYWRLFKKQIGKSLVDIDNFKDKQVLQVLKKDSQTPTIQEYLQQIVRKEGDKFIIPQVGVRGKIRSLVIRNKEVHMRLPDQQNGLRQLRTTVEDVKNIRAHIRSVNQKNKQEEQMMQRQLQQDLLRAQKKARNTLSQAGVVSKNSKDKTKDKK